MLTVLPDPHLQLPVPSQRQVDIWQIDLDDAGWHAHAAVLAVDEQQRAARFLRDQPRQRYLHGRVALRLVLAAYTPHGDARMLITYGAWGKPQLAGGGVFFNITHSAGLALLAVAAVEVGIDVESLRRAAFDINGLDRQICSPTELEQLQTLPATQRSAALYQLWTQKEAWSKSSGHGLQRDFRAVTVQTRADGAGHCIHQPDGVQHLHAVPLDGAWCASLCHPSPDILVQRREARPASAAIAV